MNINRIFQNVKLPGLNKTSSAPPGDAPAQATDGFAFSLDKSGEVKLRGQEVHGLKKAGAMLTVAGMAAGGALLGFKAATLATPVLGPLAFWGIGAYVFRGKGIKVNDRELRDVLTIFKPAEGDSRALKIAKNAVNYTARAGVAAVAGILGVAAAPILGAIGGGKLGLHAGAEVAAEFFGPNPNLAPPPQLSLQPGSGQEVNRDGGFNHNDFQGIPKPPQPTKGAAGVDFTTYS